MPCPAVLTTSGKVEERQRELQEAMTAHFGKLRDLAAYSRQDAREWFPRKTVQVDSIVRPIIASTEQLAIALLTGNEPQVRVSHNAADMGSTAPAEPESQRNTRWERIVTALWATLDNQFATSLYSTIISRNIKQGEVILQYGWLSEAERLVHSDGDDDRLESVDPLAGPPDEDGPQLDHPTAYGAGLDEHRFPIFVRVLDRLRVVYELAPEGYALEVYQKYQTTVSRARELWQEWDPDGTLEPGDQVEVIEAWCRGWRTVVVDGDLALRPTQHMYGAYPPFIIEQSAPEDVSLTPGLEGMVEEIAGVPFAYHMIPAFMRACRASSMKDYLLETHALGVLALENMSADRKEGELHAGPGIIPMLYPDEKLVSVPPTPLPPALAAALEEAEGDAEALSFSRAMMRGGVPGEPSGYAIEQNRLSSNARLAPYKISSSRALSRLFVAIFKNVLRYAWAEEWGETMNLAHSQGPKLFIEQVRPEELESPPEHIAITIIPATPQDRAADSQRILSEMREGAKDPLVAIEELGSQDPITDWQNIMVRKAQMTVPQLNLGAVYGILQHRQQELAGANISPADKGSLMPMFMAPPPPPGIGGPPGPGGPPGQTAGPPGAPGGPASGPPPSGGPPPGAAPRQGPVGQGGPQPTRPPMRPQGMNGTPNNPHARVDRAGIMELRRGLGGRGIKGRPKPMPPARAA